MAGRRRVGARHVPRHARPNHIRGIAVAAAGGIAALSGAILLANAPAGAEASTTTATLTLTGVRDSNCDFSTGGSTVYVKPGGDIKFRAELAGIKLTIPPLLGIGKPKIIDLSTTKLTSFDFKLIVDGDKKHAHLVSGKKTWTMHNVSAGPHRLAWSANSVNVLGLHVPLNADHVLPSSLPVGGQLDWVGTAESSKTTKCGISIQVPGGGVTIGPIHLSVPPIVGPTLPEPTLPTLPGGGTSSSGHHPGNGGGSSSPAGGGGSTSTSQTPIPELVVPNAGSGGDSAFGGGGLGGVGALPDTGGVGPIAPGAVTSTAAGPSSGSSSKAKPVDLATNRADDGLGGPQLPVLLAIVAIIALSLVTATYARMYLLRKPPANPAA